jgi:hypothetical protein
VFQVADLDAGQPGVGLGRIAQQPGVGDIHAHPGARWRVRRNRRAGFGFVTDLFGFGGRARSLLAVAADGQDMVGGGGAAAEAAVNRVERVSDGRVRLAQGQPDEPAGDRADAVGFVLVEVVAGGLLGPSTLSRYSSRSSSSPSAYMWSMPPLTATTVICLPPPGRSRNASTMCSASSAIRGRNPVREHTGTDRVVPPGPVTVTVRRR